jgi:outer membrane protein insertion porin family
MPLRIAVASRLFSALDRKANIFEGWSDLVFLRSIILLAGLSVLAPAPTSAAVPGPTPIDLQDLTAWQGREVTTLDLKGLPEHLLDAARRGLALTPRRKIVSRRLATLTTRTATADVRRLRLLLARRGYPDAEISVQAEADGRKGVKLTIAIQPGPAVHFRAVTTEGLPLELAAIADSVRAAFAPDRRFDEQALQGTRQALLRSMQRAGFARPQVLITVMRPQPRAADVVFACTPGERFVYEGLKIHGAPSDLAPLVRRTVRLQPGTPYHPRIITDTRHHLRQLQLFRQIRLQADTRDSTTLDLIVDLRPRDMLTAEASVGTFTDNWLVLRGGVTHRNIWKKGRGLFLGASWATYSRHAEFRTWWPALLTARSRTEWHLRHEIHDEDSYRLDKTEVAVSNLFTGRRHTSLRLGVAASQGVLADRSVDPDAFASEVGLQTLLYGILYRDTSDNPLDPARGHRLTIQADWSAPGFWTRTPFSSLRASGSWYVPLGESSVAAMRLDGGAAWPLGKASDLRPDRRWFAGGASSMRGYRRRQLGPLDGDGNPIGGEVRLLAGVEARIAVWSIFKTAVFLDSGQVWRRSGEVDLGDLETAAGIGLLIASPVGPLRLDLARHLGSPASGQPRTLLHFGIGHPF